MFPVIDAIVAIGSLIIPPVFDFVKKKFVKAESDTPERTMGNLATTKPEVLAEYTTSLETYMDAQTKFFNRDISGTPSQWVVDLRAAIRPTVVAVGVLALVVGPYYDVQLQDGVRLFFEAAIMSWFGSRLTQ